MVEHRPAGTPSPWLRVEGPLDAIDSVADWVHRPAYLLDRARGDGPFDRPGRVHGAADAAGDEHARQEAHSGGVWHRRDMRSTTPAFAWRGGDRYVPSRRAGTADTLTGEVPGGGRSDRAGLVWRTWQPSARPLLGRRSVDTADSGRSPVLNASCFDIRGRHSATTSASVRDPDATQAQPLRRHRRGHRCTCGRRPHHLGGRCRQLRVQ